uniref:ABC transporter substrate-binding protein n=1 Tax=Panagrellus redivivus TaxID=6233 RepID=A0A7E4VV69_PANRE
MDTFGFFLNSKKGKTAVQYEGFTRDFVERAYVFSSCHAIDHPLKEATSSGTTRADK